ncbi:hypothetical protein V3C99_017059 [Haemonchus contortus]|uniref:Transposase n=1 Tax=Haemonchus contortus TaxID=6289 RepID=A0A7I4YYC5_HAECO
MRSAPEATICSSKPKCPRAKLRGRDHFRDDLARMNSRSKIDGNALLQRRAAIYHRSTSTPLQRASINKACRIAVRESIHRYEDTRHEDRRMGGRTRHMSDKAEKGTWAGPRLSGLLEIGVPRNH